MTMPWCPKCRAEYRDGFTQCSTCGVPLVDELPAEQPEAEPQAAQPEGMEKPVAVYLAQNRMEAEMVCEMLNEQGIAAVSRPAAFRQLKAYSGSDTRFGVEVLVDAAQTAAARQHIEQMKQELAQSPLDEDELARLAEEQAMETPEQPAEDNVSFKLLPVVVGVLAAALVLLYLVSSRL